MLYTIHRILTTLKGSKLGFLGRIMQKISLAVRSVLPDLLEVRHFGLRIRSGAL